MSDDAENTRIVTQSFVARSFSPRWPRRTGGEALPISAG